MVEILADSPVTMSAVTRAQLLRARVAIASQAEDAVLETAKLQAIAAISTASGATWADVLTAVASEAALAQKSPTPTDGDRCSFDGG
jgi:hypothetical protein